MLVAESPLEQGRRSMQASSMVYPKDKLILLFLLAFLTACASNTPAKRATEAEGPVSVRARNSLASDNPEGLVAVAEGFEKAGNFQGANNLYGQAMAASPSLIPAQIGYARTLTKLGQLSRGREIIEGLLSRFPHDKDIVLAAADLLTQTGEFERARQLVKQLADQLGSGHGILDLLGRLDQVTGREDAARNSFNLALKQAPQNAETLKNLALSFALEGEYESAVALLQRAMDNPRTQMQAKRSLAFVYALSGQRKAARVIAMSAVPPEELATLEFLFDLLPRMSKEQQAIALMFDRIPVDLMRDRKGS